MKDYYIYILANKARGTIYIGVTNNVSRRIQEHFDSTTNSFTHKYNLKRLVYLEQTQNIEMAIQREKQLKHWRRQWKINLIESQNPYWQDLGKYWGMDPETSSG